MGHGDFAALSYSCFFSIFTQFTKKMIAKTILKIEIRVRFMKIRGIFQLVPLEMQDWDGDWDVRKSGYFYIFP